MARIAIIVGHPRLGSFCQALAENYEAGAKRAGHEVTMLSLSHMQFDPILHEGFAREQTLEPDLQSAHDAILAAEHLVFVFPLWIGGMPALLKGFLERVLQPDLMRGVGAKSFPKLWRNKSVRIFLSMAMPALVYRWVFGAHELRMIQRSILGLIGAGPVRSTLIGNVDKSIQARRRALHLAVELGYRCR